MILSGCMTSEMVTKQDSSLFYQKDIKFKVETKNSKNEWALLGEFRGGTVIPQSDIYKISVFPEGNADLLSVTSCHREMRTQDPDKEGFRKGYAFEIKPVPELESGRACPIEVGVYEKKKGRNGWATIAIENKKYNLSVDTKCNGALKSQGGVSFCQSRKGLIQEYVFNRQVEAVYTSGCEVGDGKPAYIYTFLMPRGPCTVYFVDSKNEAQIHQANLYGYDEILMLE